MASRSGKCEACGSRFPLTRMRRLVWALVCIHCEKKLSGVRRREVRQSEPSAPPEGAIGVVSVDLEAPAGGVRQFLSHLPSLLFYLGLALLGRFGSEQIGLLLSGALCAELIAWCVICLLRAPFESGHFLVEFCVRLGAILLVNGPGLPYLDSATGLSLGAVGFFTVLIVRSLWFVCWWNDMIDDPAGSDLEEFLPQGRELWHENVSDEPVDPVSRTSHLRS